MQLRSQLSLASFLTIVTLAGDVALGQGVPAARDIYMVYMGGNDCPPCVVWRSLELPKLRQSETFKSIRFTYVVKVIRSPVPPSFFLPEEVKPYKKKLDFASSGQGGSSQTAIIVDGEVYDYYYGYRTAAEVEQMIAAIRSGSQYPFNRCLKVNGYVCDVHG